MSPANYRKNDSIIIIGAGIFGLSTAMELTQRGYTNITVLDRYQAPVPDGSSVDISRIIRVEYGDELYARMAREALVEWNSRYKDHFYPSGFAMLAEKTGNMAYFNKTQEMNDKFGDTKAELTDAAGLKRRYKNFPANLEGVAAYINPEDGWADAEAAISQLAQECSQAGVSFLTGPRGRVTSLRIRNGKVIGVHVAQGEPVLASQVIMSTGAWSNRLLPMGHASTASGQSVGFVELSDEEARSLEGMPVIQNWSTGLFVFPPYPSNHSRKALLKVVRHGFGFATSVSVNEENRVVSSPMLNRNNAASGWLPEDGADGLRDGLRQLVPQFADRPWFTRRMCWYSDTPEGDFIIDRHPQLDGLFLATGGAGHSFKFMPILGRYIADVYENKASPELRRKWRFRLPDVIQESPKTGDGSRGGPPLRTLRPDEQAKL
ncbi:unnamed protein product [Penicillium salamii]|nr:unnamed protein product [Penicillium salamii]